MPVSLHRTSLSPRHDFSSPAVQATATHVFGSPSSEPSRSQNVYAIVGRDDIVIGIAKEAGPAMAGRLQREAAQLAELQKLGLPAVEVVEIIDHAGHAAIVMKRYSQGSKTVVRTIKSRVKLVGESPLLNERSIQDLQRIREVLQTTPLTINDLQFLVGRDGSIVVADIISYTMWVRPSKVNIQTVDRLIDAAKASIAKKKGNS